MTGSVLDPVFPSPYRTGVIHVTGPDAFAFLQNIITHDLSLLDSHPSLPACLLSPQGKYLHDFAITRTADGYCLICDGSIVDGNHRGEDLLRRLSVYKLRANISLSLSARTAPDDLPPFDTFSTWDMSRIRAALPDGVRDADIGTSTLSELNLDTLCVSYTKGCYIGQEVVARMHNRNTGKKHLVAVAFPDTMPPPPTGTDFGPFGQMRSSCGNIGLVLMNRDCEDSFQQGHIKDAPFRLLGL